jgi:Arc/MetJ-type ribon-helix-helix transcriptional regulator
LTNEDVAAVVASGRFGTRSDVLRAGLHLVLRQEREREIGAAYRRGYTENPQEEWPAQIGLAGLQTALGVALDLG